MVILFSFEGIAFSLYMHSHIVHVGFALCMYVTL